MKEWFIIIVLGLALLGTSFMAGRLSVHEDPSIVPERIDIDSLKNVLLSGKVSVVDLMMVKTENFALRAAIEELKKKAYIPDSMYVDPSDSDRPVIPKLTSIWRIDTSFEVGTNAYITIGNDSLDSEVPARMNLDIAFIGDPLNAFEINNISIAPLRIKTLSKAALPANDQASPDVALSIQNIISWDNHIGAGFLLNAGRFASGFVAFSEEKTLWMAKVRATSEDPLYSMNLLVGWNGGIGTGAMINIERFGIGWMAIANSHPAYLLSLKIL